MRHCVLSIIKAIPILALCAVVSAQTVNDPSLVVETVTTTFSLAVPTAMAFLATNDILVCEKETGRVRRVINGVTQAGSVLDLAVAYNGERGLLGMALDPDFGSNNFVYLFYTRSSTGSDNITSASDNRVERFLWNGSTLTFSATLLTIVLSSPTESPNHEGGVITFGPPGAAPSAQKLFIITGDLARNNQPQNYGSGGVPDGTSSILRVNTDGTAPSGGEAGPFIAVAGGNPWLEKLYAYGIRNSFGMDFDPVTDGLWMTDNGSTGYDEINRVDPALNGGWEFYMGPSSVGTVCCSPGLIQFSGVGTYSEPEFSFQTSIAPTSIHFLRGSGLGASYLNDCFVGEANLPRGLYHFDLNSSRTAFALSPPLDDLVLNTGDINAQIRFGQGFGTVTDLETGPDGNLYVLSLINGQIYRIRAPSASVKNWEAFD